jgi:hypothetical protein
MKCPICPICPYCGKESEAVSGDVVYPHREDLYFKTFYRCKPCDAYVGCHPGTVKPLGRLANAELRSAKQQAHNAFDPTWQGGGANARKIAYRWLALKLGVHPDDCHIGMMDKETCLKVVEICKKKVSA